ncbi:DUF4340 domain-containing protein [Planctomycetota bacterium]|nr:DUF4340 domain-containing protein [Planctomycetota bacterium]
MSEEKRHTPDDIINQQRKAQKFILIILIVALAGGIGLDRLFSDDSNNVVAKETQLIDKDTDFKQADVALIEISPAAGTPFTLKKVNDQWQVVTRSNAPANSAIVNSLFTKLFDAQFLSIPVTADPKQFVVYSLDDKTATTLTLKDKAGKELLTLMVGKAPEGNRDFVRKVGNKDADEAEDAVYELVYKKPAHDSLFSRLNMKGTTDVNAARWLDLSNFKVMPLKAEAQSLTLASPTETVSLTRKAGSDPIENVWDMVTPTETAAEGMEVQRVISDLTNLSALDVAGTMSGDGPELGFGKVSRRIIVEYTTGENADAKDHRVELTFGKSEGDNTAVNMYDESKGTFIYWVNSGTIDRMFRPSHEFLKPQVMKVKLQTEKLTELAIKTKDYECSLERVPDNANAWRILKPEPHRANASEVLALRPFLEGLSGYPAGDLSAQIKDERWISFTYEFTVAGEDNPKTAKAVLAFGEPNGALTPARLDKDGASTYFHVHEDELTFALPAYNDLRVVKLARVVIGYKGAESPKMIDKERTKEAAELIANEALVKAQAEGADIEAIQTEYNEDFLPVKAFDIKSTSVRPDDVWTQAIIDDGMALPVGGTKLIETRIGYVIIIRTE